MLPAVETTSSLIPFKWNDQRQTRSFANIPVKIDKHSWNFRTGLTVLFGVGRSWASNWLDLDATKDVALVDGAGAARSRCARLRRRPDGPELASSPVAARGSHVAAWRMSDLPELPHRLWRICCVLSPPPKPQKIHGYHVVLQRGILVAERCNML